MLKKKCCDWIAFRSHIHSDWPSDALTQCPEELIHSYSSTWTAAVIIALLSCIDTTDTVESFCMQIRINKCRNMLCSCVLWPSCSMSDTPDECLVVALMTHIIPMAWQTKIQQFLCVGYLPTVGNVYVKSVFTCFYLVQPFSVMHTQILVKLKIFFFFF